MRFFFDGVDNVVNCGAEFTSISNALSVEIWIKPLGVIPGQPDIFLVKYQDDNNRWYVRMNDDNTLMAYAKDEGSLVIGTSNGELVTSEAVIPNVWHHLVFTAMRGDSCYWYVDGNEKVSGPVNDLSFANTGALLIGAYRTGRFPGDQCHNG